jgi:hypothetical protein
MAVMSAMALMSACGHAPPPKPPPTELAANTAADLQGKWVADDDMAFYYAMAIQADGAIDVVTDRGRLGRCEQKGTLAPTGAKAFHVTYAIDECDRAAVGRVIELKVESFTAEALIVVLNADGMRERHVYKRDPKAG